jgi:2-succinyl-5-enolpyruvyl-6-hydroxy-3-cyclohexene-1-carboxylate synthase
MKINRNIAWAEIFFNELASHGVKYVCIAPGSRSTPLTFSAAVNNKLKSYAFIDERSCSFFALGLAINSNTPVALICTSGTAVAEFYPAIIEAYQQKVPLIICTADRSPELIDNGANQTIIQNGIYKNHVLWSNDTGLPELTVQRLKHISSIGRRAVFESSIKNAGPVHINFPFRKPLEPGSFTDDINDQLLSNIITKESDNPGRIEPKLSFQYENEFKKILSLIRQNKKGILIAGPGRPS